MNVSTIVAAMLGWAVLSIRKGDRPQGAIGLMLAIVIKYAGVVLLPIAVLLGRWKMLCSLAVLTLILFGATIAVAGMPVFREFATQIGADAVATYGAAWGHVDRRIHGANSPLESAAARVRARAVGRAMGHFVWS